MHRPFPKAVTSAFSLAQKLISSETRQSEHIVHALAIARNTVYNPRRLPRNGNFSKRAELDDNFAWQNILERLAFYGKSIFRGLNIYGRCIRCCDGSNLDRTLDILELWILDRVTSGKMCQKFFSRSVIRFACRLEFIWSNPQLYIDAGHVWLRLEASEASSP